MISKWYLFKGVNAIYNIWKQIRLGSEKTYILGECVHNGRHTQKQNLYHENKNACNLLIYRHLILHSVVA